MKKFIIILILLAMPLICLSQGGYSIYLEGKKLFSSAYVGNNEYFIITNADTIQSLEIGYTNRMSGNLRVSVRFDTTSGTTKTYMDVKVKVADFNESTDWVTTLIDSFVVTDDATLKTYQISQSGYTFMDDPVLAIQLVFRQVGTQVNRIKPCIIYYEP